MIRIRGFAGKIRRATKGGSLPASAREASARNGQSDHTDQPEMNMGNNGHNNGNGTEAIHRNGTDDLTATARGRATSNGAHPEQNNDALATYLHDVVEKLVEPPTAIEGRGPLDLSSVDGEVLPQFETLFAQAAMSIGAGRRVPWWKRVFDFFCIIVTMAIWFPLLVLVMAWIKAVSPGPIFYRQQRVGHRGRRFMLFKFRTMHVNAETRTHEEYFAHLMNTDSPMTKLDALDDHRLIRGGRLLRASGLDELPQLFNVLRGQMSLVGPRPCLPNEFMLYTPAQRARVNALPGLTGYWQVNGKNKTTFSEMIAMDVFYAENISVALDLGIIARTIPALVMQTLESRRRNGAPEIEAAVRPS